MEKIKLDILGISYSQSQSGAYALILGEHKGKRRLPIIIGGFEAQSIAIELEKMKPSRPLTHDLIKELAGTFNINITEVVIYKFVEGIFFAKLVCNYDSKVYEIDSRTSDAVALAVRFKCPIYTYEKIMTSAGIILDDLNQEKEEAPIRTKDDYDSGETKEGAYAHLSMSELEEVLQKAIQEEAYEKASIIRDEIKRRRNK